MSPADDLPERISIGDKYTPAMSVSDQAAADAMFERMVRHTMRFGVAREEAERIERANLGYYAGYYDHETRQRVERLFRCQHPMLGPAGAAPLPPEEVFRRSIEAGRKLRGAT